MPCDAICRKLILCSNRAAIELQQTATLFEAKMANSSRRSQKATELIAKMEIVEDQFKAINDELTDYTG